MYDLLIRQARIVDGTGGDSYIGDVGIKGERIAWVGASENRPVEAGQESGASENKPAETGQESGIIEGKGLVLTPGFVDMHGHSDYTLLIDPLAESKLRQGITTEVVGNCGYSAAPVAGPLLRERKLEYETVFGLSLDWQSFPEYLKRVEAASLNYVFLVGHNTMRASAMGFENCPPSAHQMALMESWLEEALDCGAFGLSTGLFYAPGCFAQKEELVRLARRVGRRGGILTSHIRSEGKGLLEALEEILSIAREAEVPLQISHLKTAGRENWWKLDQALEMIESARSEGVTCDRYPYLASQTSLQSLLPDWAQEGGAVAIVRRLRDLSVRRDLVQQLLTEHRDYWADIYISLVSSKAYQDWEGLSLAQLAADQNRPPVEVALDLLKEDGIQVDIIHFCMSEENLIRILRHPLTMIGSDSSSRSIEGPLRIGRPHPRSFGTFPRVIRKFCYEKRALSLEEGVQKMTSFPCQKLGLKDRGIIREGMMADLALFDPECIADKSTYQDPFRYPAGIRLVMVNGRICIKDDDYIQSGRGRILASG